MTPRKRGIMARLFGLKRDESTERFQRARVARVEREQAELDAEQKQRDSEIEEAREQTDEATQTLGACATSLSDVLMKKAKDGAAAERDEREREATAS